MPTKDQRPPSNLLRWGVPLLASLFGACGGAGLTGAPEKAYLVALDGWEARVLFTVGEDLGGFRPLGALDGLAAMPLDAATLRVYANHEVGRGAGRDYTLANGLRLTGARITAFDVDRQTRSVVGAGPAYDRLYDRYGAVVTSAQQVNEGTSATDGLQSLCSCALFRAGERGFVDDLYLTGEESDNGTHWALDTANRALWACPALGRGAWENACALETGCDDRIALLMGDDRPGAPLYLWIGVKQNGGAFLERNGLAQGQLYAWAAASGAATPEGFQGLRALLAGAFEPVTALDVAMAGKPGHDALGYLDALSLRTAALAAGAFSFSRPEDVHTNPADGTQAVFASTGRGSLYACDDWGAVYLVDLDVGGLVSGGALPSAVPATIEILADADEEPVPDDAIRSPDNVTWSPDGFIYVQEDRSTQLHVFGGVSGRDASIWQLDPVAGAATRIAEVDRQGAGNLGDWETSGVLDVTDLFIADGGERLLLVTVMAHTLKDGVIADADLVEGGQLLLLSR